jgi:hypothetical protein
MPRINQLVSHIDASLYEIGGILYPKTVGVETSALFTSSMHSQSPHIMQDAVE